MTEPRRTRGAATRERIMSAATELFCRDGYLTTTVGQIAGEAGVAVQTLYLAFGSKVGILSAVHDVAIVGDDEPVPLLDRPWVRRVEASPDAATGWSTAVAALWESTVRVAPIYTVIQRAAADPAVARLLEQLHDDRLRSSRAVAGMVLALPGTRPDPDPDRLADVIYATLTAETYTLLVSERGWLAEQWRQWTHDVIAAELLP